MDRGNILILNKNSEERELFSKICSNLGSVYSSSNLERAIVLFESINFNVLVIDYALADYSSLKGLLKKSISIIITGIEEKKIKEIIKQWPLNLYVDYHITPLQDQDNNNFLRVLKTAVDHSLLRIEAENLKRSIDRTEVELKDAYFEIKEIKNVINESVIRELEKRIELEAKYIWFKREKHKIEEILKNIYTANDVTTLLDIVHDIKEIVLAQSISIYLLDENETLGKYLKPLVWDNAFLSHPDFSKHIVLIDSQDFAASAARYGQEINIADLSFDRRMSKRYVNQLKTPLTSILCVPIMHAKEVIGVLEVYNKTHRKKSAKEGFTREDQQIMRTLSEHISLAITKLNLIQHDALTGLLRPDPFFEKVIQKIKSERKRRQEETSFAMVMGDVDWFKNYNDRNGHQAGNKLLRELAKVLKSSTREEDLLCRYGGEEFLFFLSDIKDSEEARHFTERMRKNIEEHYFDYQEYQPRNNLTMSFGITYFPRDRIDSLETISKIDIKKIANEADIALAEAKGKKIPVLGTQEKKESNSIKNKVCVYQRKQIGEPGKDGVKGYYKENYIQERRKHERYSTSAVLIYKRNSSHNVTKTINLSLGGAKIYTESKLPSDQTLDLILILRNKICQLKGDVVYSEIIEKDFSRCCSGLKFKDLSLEDRKILNNYFASLRTKKTASLTQ